ncbi:hypothetical protein D3C86_1961960 [compost metagenome]
MLDDDALQVRFVTDILGQHQFDERALRQAAGQQVDELRVMIRREAGGSCGSGHVGSASGGTNLGDAGILGGMTV